jgi:hypothetical protein
VVGTNPNTQRKGLPFLTQTHKTKTKRTIKIIFKKLQKPKRKQARNNRDK